MAAEPSRNAPCPCGSGKRYKHCHGAAAGAGIVGAAPAFTPAPAAQPQARFEALAAHRAGQLGRAETLYREALAREPDDVDVLHMLGVVQLQRLRNREALDLLWRAAERSGWALPEVRHNLGILLGKLVTREANARQAVLLERYLALERARRQAVPAGVWPVVSVVVRAGDADAAEIAAMVACVADQRYSQVELVAVVADADGPVALAVRRGAQARAIPLQVVECRAASGFAAINAGAAAARGTYLAFLDVGDRYAQDRMVTLADEIARRGLPWGFSLVVDGAETHVGGGADEAVGSLAQRQRIDLGTPPTSFALVERNVAVATGNLFVEHAFFDMLGGFRDVGAHADWDFCLRACAHAEPAVVRAQLYRVGPATRAHAMLAMQSNADRDRVLAAFLGDALSGASEGENPLAPHRPENRPALLKLVFRANHGALVPAARLRELAQALRGRAAVAPPAASTAPQPRSARTALVVLGMHRSGTSAMSRVLNLCGAVLPEKVKPGKLGVNPKGFWEPEAVLDLNARVLAQLGGDWDRVSFALPEQGSVVDEFLADAHEILAAEYGDAATIVIKDPRICVLAPLWHRALEGAGYLPKYVVPIRNPLEVAQSLNARGDMTVERGLALWLEYMKAVVAFADRHRDDVVFVTYAGLLEDWRATVGTIAGRLGVPLDTVARAADVDRFLERDLRNQAADAAFEALPDDSVVAAVRALYKTCLARCEDGASSTYAAVPRVADAPIDSAASRTETLGFVLCIENNGIRDQALLLCESIRRYGGRHRDGPILAYAPRPRLGVDPGTRARLAELRVEYIDEPLNTTCAAYAPANRVFAGAHAERHSDADFLAVLDSDTVWLDEPALPSDVGADVGVRVVDEKGSATRGADDPFEDYWSRMAESAGVPLDRLPIVETTIGRERIRASYNAGLAIARRSTGVFARCAEIFARSLEQGLRPYRGAGINIHASTGDVGQAGSEYWGSSQTALTLAIWSATRRVQHYPDHYNVPLHMIAAAGEIDPRWTERPPTHLHYHWMFGRRHFETAIELCAALGLADDRLAWIRSRAPLDAE